MSERDRFDPRSSQFYRTDIYHDGARFASQDELTRDGYGEGGRLSFGYVPAKRGDKGVMETTYNGVKMGILIAPPRSDKGTTMIRMAMDHPGSLVSFSPRGEEAAATYHYRKEVLGQDCVLIDPLNIVAPAIGAQQDSIDLMDLLDPKSPMFFEDSFSLADGFSIPSDDTNGFWDNAMLDFATTAIMAGKSDPIDGQAMTMPDALSLFSMPFPDLQERLLGKFKTPTNKGDKPVKPELIKKGLAHSEYQMVREGVARIANAEERTRNNIFSTVHAQARAFQSEVIQNALSKSTFDLNDLAKGNMTIYIVIPTFIAPFLASIIKLIITSCLYAVGRSMRFPDPPCLTLWDETFLCGTSSTLMDTMGIQSGDGNQIVTCWHDVSQIQQLYPRNWQTFISTAGYVAIFGNNDPETQKFFSEYGDDMGGSSMSYQSARMTAMPFIDDDMRMAGDGGIGGRLITQTMIKTMRPWEALFFPANSLPVFGYKAPYFLDAKYRDRSGKPLFDQPPRYRHLKTPKAIDFKNAGDDLPEILSKYMRYG